MGMGQSFLGFMGGGMWLLVVAVIALIVWALTLGTRNGNSDSHGSSPDEILKRRLANGEITRDEFRKLQSELHA